MIFTTLRLSNRQFAMLKRIESSPIIRLDEIRQFNQITLGSLAYRGLVSLSPRSAHCTSAGKAALLSYFKIGIYRKLASANLFAGFEEQVRRKA